MRDVIVLAVIAVFFALCVAYVRWCDRIIGPDPDGLLDIDVDTDDHEPSTLDDAPVDPAVAAGALDVDRRAPDAEAVRA